MALLHSGMNSIPVTSYSLSRLGNFIYPPYQLWFDYFHVLFCYVRTQINNTLAFPKKYSALERKMRAHWATNNVEDFAFDNALDSFKDYNHGSEKLQRDSFGVHTPCFLRTACPWKIFKLCMPINSSDVELKILCRSMLRV